MDLNVDKVHLYDQFEYPLFKPTISPFEIAETIVKDLKLPLHFLSKITHSMTEQLVLARMNYDHLELEYDADELVDDSGEMGPEVSILEEDEIEQRLKDDVRNSRRVKRQRSNFGISSENIIQTKKPKINSMQEFERTKIVDTDYIQRNNVDFEKLEEQLAKCVENCKLISIPSDCFDDSGSLRQGNNVNRF